MPEIKAYQLNEYEVWASTSLQSAIDAACRETGLPPDEATDEPYQLTVSDLEKITFFDEDYTPLCSLAERLQMVRELYPDSVPCVFACRE